MIDGLIFILSNLITYIQFEDDSKFPKFTVMVTGKTDLRLPIDTTELNAECNPAVPNESKWSTYYKWSLNDKELEDNSSLSTYKACNLEEGDHFYTVSVWCTNNKNSNLLSEKVCSESLLVEVSSGKC